MSKPWRIAGTRNSFLHAIHRVNTSSLTCVSNCPTDLMAASLYLPPRCTSSGLIENERHSIVNVYERGRPPLVNTLLQWFATDRVIGKVYLTASLGFGRQKVQMKVACRKGRFLRIVVLLNLQKINLSSTTLLFTILFWFYHKNKTFSMSFWFFHFSKLFINKIEKRLKNYIK